MFRLRTTASISLLVLAGATGMSLWMSAWPRMQDHSVEAAVSARHRAPAEAARPRPTRKTVSHASRPAVVHAARAVPSPPAPAYAPSPAYPMEALRKQRGGVVTLRVSVDASGNVTAVNVAHSSGDPALDASARKTMQRWRFQAPADGKSMTFDYPVEFRIGTTAQ